MPPELPNEIDGIAAECIRTIAHAKDLPPASITEASTLEELGLDSLDRVSLSFDLEEKYGVEIPEHRLATIVTVGDIVNEVQAALAKRVQPAHPKEPAA